MAFGDVVQAVQNSVASGSVTVTFASAAAGNLLVFCVARSTALAPAATWGTPTGWTMLTSTPDAVGNIGAAWYYKIAAGGETSVSSTESTPPGNGRGIVVEFAGPFAAAPLDVTAENESNLATVVTSQSSGTTPTTTQAAALAVAFFAIDSAINADGGRSYNNSFTEAIYADPTLNNARAAAACARRVLSTTGAYSTTFSCVDTGDEMYGAIAVFKAQAGTAQQLAVQDATHDHAVDGIVVTARALLVSQDAAHATITDSVALVSHGVLGIQDALHGHGVESMALTARVLLISQDALHGHGLEPVTLAVYSVLLTQDTAHSHSTDGLALTANAAITSQDARHVHLVSAILFAASVTPVLVWQVARRGVASTGKGVVARLDERRGLTVGKRQNGSM